MVFETLAISLFLGLIFGAWMYSDAKERDGDKWGAFLLGLVLSLIGLIIWFFIRPKKSKNKKIQINSDSKALGVLKSRYAKGKITKKQYQEMKSELNKS